MAVSTSTGGGPERSLRSVSGELDEASLLRRARDGDRSAADRLATRTYEMVYASLYRLVGGNADLAADLTQETYRKAWRALDRFDGRAKLATWLYRIAYNTFLNHVRRPLPVQPLDEAEGLEEVGDGLPKPDERAESGEVAERMRRAVVGLPEELRYVVTARFWGEVPVRDIARHEEITPAAVRKRLKKAYLMLELALEEAQE